MNEIEMEVDSDSVSDFGFSSNNELSVESIFSEVHVDHSTTFSYLITVMEDVMQLLKYIRKFKLISDSYKCSGCEQNMLLTKVPLTRTHDGYMWRCVKCCKWRSLRKGTWFENSRLSIKMILLLTYFFCWELPVSFVVHELDLSTKSVIVWMEACGKVCSNVVSKWDKIGGPGEIVQIGEAYFGRKKDKLAWRNKQTWFLGATLNGGEGKKFVLRELKKHDRTNLLATICDIVKKGSEIHLVCVKGYGDLEELNSYPLANKHLLQFKECKGDTCTVMVKKLLDEVKCDVKRGRRGRSGRGLQPYLDEYMWRKSVAHNGCIFKNYLRCVADMYVPAQKD